MCVCNGEVRVGSGSGGVGKGDCVIQSKARYSELVDKNLGEDEEEILQAKKQACNEKLFVELEHNQNFWLTWHKTTIMLAFFKDNDYSLNECNVLCVIASKEEVVVQSSTQNWKRLIMYNKNHGITSMSEHVVSRHFAMLK
jgi:hypothetical protein